MNTLRELTKLRGHIDNDRLNEDYQKNRKNNPWHCPDLNWAKQQIRPTGKPAGDVEEYNQRAERWLNTYIPSMSALKAADLLDKISELKFRLVEEYTNELLERDDYDMTDATYTARHAVSVGMALSPYLAKYGKNYMIKTNTYGLGHMFPHKK